jgi:hypothetical protein
VTADLTQPGDKRRNSKPYLDPHQRVTGRGDRSWSPVVVTGRGNRTCDERVGAYI